MCDPKECRRNGWRNCAANCAKMIAAIAVAKAQRMSADSVLKLPRRATESSSSPVGKRAKRLGAFLLALGLATADAATPWWDDGYVSADAVIGDRPADEVTLNVFHCIKPDAGDLVDYYVQDEPDREATLCVKARVRVPMRDYY